MDELLILENKDNSETLKIIRKILDQIEVIYNLMKIESLNLWQNKAEISISDLNYLLNKLYIELKNKRI
ncbi:MAG: hypothetical protein ACTSPY_04810 [Candidatus Helarchaeota archaeon]